LSKYERSSTSLSTFVWNWAENYQPVIDLYQTADHPALSPKSALAMAGRRGGSPWRIYLADSASPRGKPVRKTRRLTGRWGSGGTLCMWLGLAHFHNGYSFLKISSNLHDIWPIFFLVPSRYKTAHFLIELRPSGDGYSLLGSKK
jgi:hypothetical protein